MLLGQKLGSAHPRTVKPTYWHLVVVRASAAFTGPFKEFELFKHQLLLHLIINAALPWWLSKEPACNVEDLGSSPEVGKSPGKGNDKPLQYSCLENSMDRGAGRTTVHGVTESQTRLRDTFSHFSLHHNQVLVRLTLLQAGKKIRILVW